MQKATDPGESLIDEFRGALRGLAKGVVIISTRGADGRHAMAATAVTSLSMTPPSMLICVNESASIYASLEAANEFYVNILSQADRPLADLCSGKVKGEARFQSDGWAEDADGLPYLAHAQAAIRCTNAHRLKHGTHGVFIGQVTSVRCDGRIDPLVYVDGRYTGLVPQAAPT